MAQLKFHLALFVILVACGQMAKIGAVSPICVDPTMGSCGSAEECTQKCEAKYLPKVEGKCALGLCSCVYDCNVRPTPGSICTSNNGECAAGCDDNCCTSRCQAKWPGATGSCQDIISTSSSLCLCSFKC